MKILLAVDETMIDHLGLFLMSAFNSRDMLNKSGVDIQNADWFINITGFLFEKNYRSFE